MTTADSKKGYKFQTLQYLEEVQSAFWMQDSGIPEDKNAFICYRKHVSLLFTFFFSVGKLSTEIQTLIIIVDAIYIILLLKARF